MSTYYGWRVSRETTHRGSDHLALPRLHRDVEAGAGNRTCVLNLRHSHIITEKFWMSRGLIDGPSVSGPPHHSEPTECALL